MSFCSPSQCRVMMKKYMMVEMHHISLKLQSTVWSVTVRQMLEDARIGTESQQFFHLLRIVAKTS